MKFRFNYVSFSVLIFVFAVMPAGADAQPANPADPVLPQNLLGREYVDIANGVSLRPPFGSEIYGGLSREPNQPPSLPGLVCRFDQWDAVVIPTSKDLVCFYDSPRRQYLVVSLLITREKTDHEQLLQARQNFWQKYPNQIAVETVLSDSMNNRPLGRLALTWQPQTPDQEKQTIQEVLIQCDKRRFFLLSLIEPASSIESADPNQLMDMIARNFKAMDEPEVKRRWLQARKASQDLLSRIEISQISQAVRKKSWYRIQMDGQDKGFRCVTEQVAEESGKKKLTMQAVSFFEPGPAASAFLQMRGWALPVNEDTPSLLDLPTGPSRLEEQYSMPEDLAAEEFRIRWTDRENAARGWEKRVVWKDGVLSMEWFSRSQQTEPVLTESMEMKEKIYLPAALASLLGRLMEKEAGREYTFLSLAPQGLGYFVQRVAAREKMEVAQAPADPPASNSQDTKTTFEIPVYYVVSRMEPHGKIVETWLDEKGMMLRQRSGGIVIQHSDEDTIKKIWPEQAGQVAF